MSILNNTIELQNILSKANSLTPNTGGGLKLPILSNPATESAIINGKEAIDSSGNKIIGTYEEDNGELIITKTITQCINKNITNIRNYAFYNFSSLTLVSFPACTTMGAWAFCSCSNLTSVNFSVCTNINKETFYDCTSLTSVSFPKCAIIGNSVFTNCISLSSASFPKCIYIDNSAFKDCTSLTSIYLTGSSLCSLANSNVFSRTGITPTKGSIFVPVSLVTSYKSATNWTYFSNRIFAYTDDTEGLITFTIDGTSYQAEEGMTWEEWVNSEYNTGGFYIDINGYVYNDSFWVWNKTNIPGLGDSIEAETSDITIINNGSYYLNNYNSDEMKDWEN